MSPPKGKLSQPKSEKKRHRASVALKREICEKYDRGVRVRDLVQEYGLPKSTICTFLKGKDKLKSQDLAKGVVSLTSFKRPPLLEKVEQLLILWITDMQLKGDSISEALICEKARKIYKDLLDETPSSSKTSPEDFQASRGWFQNFRKRSGIHCVLRHGEAASSDVRGAKAFVTEFADYVRSEGFIPQQCFNCDETGLFWKKMPNRTYITQEEKKLPGHKPMKDRLTLLFCANASGDCKIKPLLVYHSENPRAFMKNKVIKGTLPVLWRANTKAWVTRILFTDWLLHIFAPAVKKYLTDNNLPLKCLLLMDNAPAHPPDMEAELPPEFDFIKIKFLPPNTTPLLQPMDQNVISNFKKLYTKALFARCFQITSDTSLTLKNFWKDHFNILHCIQLVSKAWNDVTVRTLQSAWKKLWPDCVAPRDFQGFGDAQEGFLEEEEELHDSVVDEVVSLGQRMGLEVDADDVTQLVEEHGEELTTEELQQLKQEQVKALEEQWSSDEDKETKRTTTAEAKKYCKLWCELQEGIQQHFPDKALSSRTIDLMNDHVMVYFRKVIDSNKTQSTLDKFFKKEKQQEEQQKEEEEFDTTTADELPPESDSPSPQ